MVLLKKKGEKNPQTERVFLVCFLSFVLQPIINISAWHHHTCSCSVHVIMVLFLSVPHEGSPSPCVNIVLVGCTVNAS